jgi:hypothetical protein
MKVRLSLPSGTTFAWDGPWRGCQDVMQKFLDQHRHRMLYDQFVQAQVHRVTRGKS